MHVTAVDLIFQVGMPAKHVLRNTARRDTRKYSTVRTPSGTLTEDVSLVTWAGVRSISHFWELNKTNNW